MSLFSESSRYRLTRAVVCTVVGVLLVVLWASAGVHFCKKALPPEPKEINDGRFLALEMKADQAEYWMNISVVLLGFLWVTFLTGQRKTPDITFFILTNACLISSVLGGYIWADFTMGSFWGASLKTCDTLLVPNVFDDYFDYWAKHQTYFLLVGFFSLGAMMVFNLLERKDSCDQHTQ